MKFLSRWLLAALMAVVMGTSMAADYPVAPGTAFAADTNTYFVGTTSTQCASTTKNNIQSFRVRNLAAVTQYITWGATSGVTSVGAPVQGTPSANTIGLLPNSVETITAPSNAWFIASSATGFEVTPGEGV